MANALYQHANIALLNGVIDFQTATVRGLLLSSSYSVDLVNNAYLSDISGGDIVATSLPLTSVTTTGGTLSGAPITFVAVGGSTTGAYVVLYVDTGTPSTSNLVAYFDTGTGLPVTPIGSNISVGWASNDIFTL